MLHNITMVDERAVVIDDWVIIADLHIGYESAMVREGTMVPRLQSQEIIQKIKDIHHKYNVTNIVVNGDLKHSFGANMSMEWAEVRDVLEVLVSLYDNVHIIRGNHDNYLITIIKKEGFDDIKWHELYFEFQCDTLTLRIFHGHKDVPLLPHDNGINIMAHEHPAIIYEGEFSNRVSYPAFVFIKSINLLIIPAFSPLMIGTNVFEFNFLSPLLQKRIAEIKDYVKAYAFIDGTCQSFP